MRKKLLSICLTLALVMGAAFSVPDAASAYSEGSGYRGSDCTSNAAAASVIDYTMNKYKHLSTYPGTGQCWGYAEKVSSLLASAKSVKYYTGLKFTKANFKSKCLNAKAGTHIRLSRDKQFNGGYGHSVVLFKVTENKVCWADNNYYGSNIVAYYTGTLDEFMWCYGQYGYINMVAKPTKYKTYTSPLISSKQENEQGGIRLTWTAVSSAKRYEIYRSYAKNGVYKRLATTQAKSYLDKSVKLGTRAYYKVKAVKSSASKYSGIIYNTLKLAAPQVQLSQNETYDVELSWEPVKKADRYKVYRKIDGGKEKLIKTTSSCSFRDVADGSGGFCQYRVKAVYDSNSSGNSAYSAPVYARIPLAAPTGLKGTLNADGTVKLTWNAVKSADLYEVLVSEDPQQGFWYCGETQKPSFTVSDREEGQVYYYCIVYYDYDYGNYSRLSDWIRI